MRTSWRSKVIVLGIICLFVGTSSISSLFTSKNSVTASEPFQIGMAKFRSREYASSTYRPTLTISYTGSVNPVVLQPQKDTFLDRLNPDTAMGTLDYLQIGFSDGAINQLMLIKFDLSSLLPGYSITSATLKLYTTDADYSVQINCYKLSYNGYFNEGDTWNNAQSHIPYDSTPVTSMTVDEGDIGTWITWNVLNHVTYWYANPTYNNGFYLRPTTGSQHNPYTPSNPSPAHQATGVSITADLSWTGGDPDPEDIVTYDVYFGTSSNPSLVMSNNPTTTYDPGTMGYSTRYYWKIVARDNHGATTTGSIWYFNTQISPNPSLSYYPTAINFGAHPQGWTGSSSFEIWNNGGGTLSYTLSESLSWITITPTSGTSTGEHDTITVNVVNTGSMSGYYSGTISISSNGGSGSVFVNITIEAPVLAYSPTEIHFGTQVQGWTGTRTFGIRNSGTGTLTYSLTESISWIEITPTSGSSTGENDTITVSAINTGSMSGYYSGTIVISSNSGSGSVLVDITITPPSSPVLTYNPNALNFYTHSPGWTGSNTFEIWNSGTGTLSYTLSESITWITVTPTTGTSTGEHDTITVNVVNTGSMSGYYSGTISISSNGGSGSVFVDITIQANNPPNTPSNPSPANHATGISVTAVLSWTGGDPDAGDTVTYDVYFGTITPPQKVIGNQSGTLYDPPGSMNYNTKYYWRINAWDNHGAKTVGSVWDFTTVGTTGDFSISNLQIIQTIQDANQFIINKDAVACINITSTFSTQKKADIKITYNHGQTYTDIGPNGNGIPLNPGWNRVYLPGGPVIHQSGTPDAAWINAGTGPWLRWTSTGADNNIKGVVDCNNEITESNENNNQLTINEMFVDTLDLRILVVPVYFPQANPPVGGNQPFTVNIDDELEYLSEIFPISENRFEYYVTNARSFTGNPSRANWTSFYSWILNNVALQLVRDAALQHYQRVLIIVHHDWFDIFGRNPWGQSWMVRSPPIREPVLIIDNVEPTAAAHEFGHTYYLWHPHDFGPAVYDCYKYDVKNRYYEQYGRTHMSLLGKLLEGIPVNPVWIDKGRYDTNPDEIRSHVFDDGPYSVKAWNLFDQFKRPSTTNLGDNQKGLIICGTINKNNSVIPIEPWYQIENATIDLYPNDAGNYFIVLTDEQHNILSKSGFNVSFGDLIEDQNGNYSYYPTNSSGFIFTLPYLSETRYIELQDSNDTIFLSKNISIHTPTVEITSPNGGEKISINDEYIISWEASDEDDDPLIYAVSYSPDGEQWTPIDWGLTEKQCIWNTSKLSPGNNYKIRIITSDGVNTAIDESNTFSLNYPSAILLGFINNMNETETYTTFNANLLLWVSFKPFTLTIYSSNESFLISNPYPGYLDESFICGKFNAIVVSNQQFRFRNNISERFRQMITPKQ